MGGAGTNVANNYANTANATAKSWSNIGSGIGQGAAAYGMANKPDANTTRLIIQLINGMLLPDTILIKHKEYYNG